MGPERVAWPGCSTMPVGTGAGRPFQEVNVEVQVERMLAAVQGSCEALLTC